MVGGYLLFEFGRLQADYNIVDAINEKQELIGVITELEDEIVALKQEIALLETNREVDRESYQVVEANLADLQRKIQEQSEAIAFYRGIVSPKDGGRGLRVQDLRLSQGQSDRHYSLHLVLVQVMQHDRSVEGEVDLTIEGVQEGVATAYELEELLADEESGNWPFAFRYFQNFDREIVLPQGFEPEKISIEVISRTKSIASVKESFDWLAGSS